MILPCLYCFRRLTILTFLIFGSFLVLSRPASAFLAESFDSPKNENVVKRGDFVGGAKKDARVPFVKSNFVEDAERGKVLEISFNVSEGFGGSYLVFKEGKLPTDFNTIRFWIRGGSSAFKIELKDDLIHSFIVEKADRSAWQEVAVPISALSNPGELDLKKIKEFVMVFEDHRSKPRLGTIYIDDLSLTKEKIEERPVEKLTGLPPVMVDGELPAGRVFSAKETPVLRLSLDIPPGQEFKFVRFEASWDGKYWFYLNELRNDGQSRFEHAWKVNSFPSGKYLLRGALVDQAGNGHAGPGGEIELKSAFDTGAFLDEVQRKTFDYFVDEVDPKTYLVKDRSTTDTVYSTGLSGFQWTAYVIGVERGWMSRKEALKRMNRTMDFFLNKLPRYQGLLTHWIGQDRKETWEKGEGDAVETVFILAGGLTASSYFDGNDAQEVAFREKVKRLYEEIRWRDLLWRPKKEDEKGFLPWRWSKKDGPSKVQIQGLNEAMIVYLLALGAPQHSISEESWKAWASTYQKGRYGSYELIACAPLFTHQYSQLWIDYRGLRDAHANYFENSLLATFVNREFSLKENGYTPEIWGLTASEGPNGYKAYGAPPTVSLVPILNDGTIAPTAAATSIMFTPPLSIAAMKDMREEHGRQIWGRFGFKDAFNPQKNWFYDGYLGLDQGPILIAIENYRTGLIWRLFMQNPYIQKGLTRAGFTKEETSPIIPNQTS